MNMQKGMHFLIGVISVMLCLTLITLGLSEGQVGDGATKITVGTSEEYYPGKAEIIEIGTSESYYPDSQPKDTSSGVAGGTDAPAPQSTEKPAESTARPTVRPSNHNTSNRGGSSSRTGSGSAAVTGMADGIAYLIRDGEVTITGVTKEALADGVLVIPAKIGKATVRYIYADAFKDVKEVLVKVELPGTVTFIWNTAFEGCSSLRSITFHGAESAWKNVARWLILPEGCTVECN